MANQAQADHSSGKDAQSRLILGIVNKVVEIAAAADTISKGEEKEKNVTLELVKDINDSEILYKIALICNTISLPGNAIDIKYDVWFMHTYWSCINRLSEIHTSEALEALRIIADHSSLDGGDRLIIKDIILNHKANFK